jgi:hypothetical protein
VNGGGEPEAAVAPIYQVVLASRLRLLPADRTADLQSSTEIVSGTMLKRARLPDLRHHPKELADQHDRQH